jgi:hypothetical protein
MSYYTRPLGGRGPQLGAVSSQLGPFAQVGIAANATSAAMQPGIATQSVEGVVAAPTPQEQANEFCVGLHRQYLLQHPDQAECLDGLPAMQAVQACMAGVLGEITQEQSLHMINAIVSQACNLSPPPPTPAPPVPPADNAQPYLPQPPPLADELQEEITGMAEGPYQVVNGGGALAPPPNGALLPTNGDTTLTDRAPNGFRRWGPVIGILLVVGGAVYLLRSR